MFKAAVEKASVEKASDTNETFGTGRKEEPVDWANYLSWSQLWQDKAWINESMIARDREPDTSRRGRSTAW